jgi:hypothetical protein
MEIRIEKAAKKDVPTIVEMIRELAAFENLTDFCEVTEEKLLAAMFGANACVQGLVAFADETPVGYALFFPNFASFRGQQGIYLEDLYVKTEFRGGGIGLQMLKRVAQIAKERGCVRIDWQVLDWNSKAIDFYRKLGAEIDESERHCKIVGENFVRLSE